MEERVWWRGKEGEVRSGVRGGEEEGGMDGGEGGGGGGGEREETRG